MPPTPERYAAAFLQAGKAPFSGALQTTAAKLRIGESGGDAVRPDPESAACPTNTTDEAGSTAVPAAPELAAWSFAGVGRTGCGRMERLCEAAEGERNMEKKKLSLLAGVVIGAVVLFYSGAMFDFFH